jgi:hypothetical protein
MPRFSSLTHAPAETRRLLRERLARFLEAEQPPTMQGDRPKLDDELFLALMLGLHIDFESDVGAARKIYDAAAAGIADHPSLDSLLRAGAIRVTWGRISMLPPHGRGEVVNIPPAGVTALRTRWHKQAFSLSSAVHARSELATEAMAIEQAAAIPGAVACQTPAWVAARLWDRSPLVNTDAKAALREWVDRWVAMGTPTLVPSRAWSAGSAKVFLDNALDVLGSDAGLPRWTERREHIIAELVLANGQLRQNIERYVLPLPPTAVGRAEWLGDHLIEQPLMEALLASADIYGLLRLILTEVEQTDLSPAPNPLSVRILALVVDRLDLFHMLLFWIGRHPRLLADLLLFSPTAALACMLIARWQPPHDAWNRELTLRDHQAAKASAFADAVSVMGHYLKQSSVPPAEVAALLEWLHSDPQRQVSEGVGSPTALIGTLRSELVGQSAETLIAMASALASSLPASGLEAPAFAAGLDVIEIGDLVAAVDPTPFVDVYLRSIAEGAYSLTAHRISQGAAVTLFALASHQSATRRNDFLFPLAVESRSKNATDQNPYTRADDIARSIRCHIRVLSRVVAGLAEEQPDDLVDALTAAVRPVPLKIQGQVSVAAFAPRHEIEGAFAKRDRPLAADIGAALTALPAAQADRVLGALLETSEPMILAQMLTHAPRSMRERIEKRIAEISPADAGEIRSLPEVQARIDTLLAAGMTASAAKFIHEERSVQTMGKAPGRVLARLHADLRLFFAQGDWASIANIQAPNDLRGLEESSARDTIAFFRALTELKKPLGDFTGAEQVFARLAQRHPTVLGYAVNRMAAGISRLLGGNGFALLQGAALAEGRKLLAETEQLIQSAQGAPDADIVTTNKALLLLAIGQPDVAIQVLAAVGSDEQRATAAAYTSVALSRLGRNDEAVATLNVAEAAFGPADVLNAAREYLAKGTPFPGFANTSLDDDPVPQVKQALLALAQMDPVSQAQALNPNRDAFDRVVIDFVRGTSGSICGLVPMMKKVTINESEDDLTAFLHRILEARVEFLGWTVSDQSRGGRTPKGNAGERDLVLRKGSTTLAVLEAVVCDKPITWEWSRQELKMHFQKLLGYDTCRVFFHLTYAYIPDLASIAAHLRQVAQAEAPDGFVFTGADDIPHTDSRPTGFIARYQGALSEVKVVFLILDLGQHTQQAASILAASNNPRNKKDGS